MKKLISVIILCCLPLLVFAQVRSKVCVVRPNYSDKVVQMINDFIPRLEKLGVEDPQKYVDDFLTKGISGSGFVYVAPNGKNYVITNRHVISDAATSTVIFEDEQTKTQKSISGMKILAADSALDLAILEFPENEQLFTKGFDFYNGNIRDGDPVFTAGYPGLMGKPVWQFGTGIITNSSVEVEEMINPELSSLIQHSAQIDGGNSGGPLLIKTKDGDYEVVGINTWKLINRQDTNFAIPSSTVIKFIESVLAGENNNSEKYISVITEKATRLHKSLNKYNVSFGELIEDISIDFVEAEGKKIFDTVIKKCSTDNRKTMNTILEKYSPIESVRYAIGWYLFNEYHKDEIVTDSSKKSSVRESKLPQLNPPEQIEGTEYWVTRLLNGNTGKLFVITWAYINGDWEILTINTGKKADYKAEHKSNANKKPKPQIPEGKGTNFGETVLYMPFTVQFAYGKNTLSPQNPKGFLTNTLDINIKILNYLSADITVDLLEQDVYIFNAGDNSSNSKIDSITPYAGIQLQLPFIKQKTMVMPYLALQGGAELSNLSDLQTDIVSKAKLGSRFYYFLLQNKFGLFFDANFFYKFNFNDFSKNDYTVNVSAGIAF